MTIRKLENRDGYAIPPGNPSLHRELAWYATDDDQRLGVVTLDLYDQDFGWVVLAKAAAGYLAINMAASCPTIEEATQQLHAAMISGKLRGFNRTEQRIARAMQGGAR
jgi:hypothetical protein